jgi:hypothetical protein
MPWRLEKHFGHTQSYSLKIHGELISSPHHLWIVPSMSMAQGLAAAHLFCSLLLRQRSSTKTSDMNNAHDIIDMLVHKFSQFILYN